MPSREEKKFTNNIVKGALAEEKRYTISCNGLQLRVSPTGYKSWSLVYHFGEEKNCRYTIGSYPAIGLADANDAVREARKLIAKGVDPRSIKTIKSEPKETFTVSTIIDNYLTAYPISDRTRKDYIDCFNLYVLPIWANKVPSEIKSADVRALLLSIIDKKVLRRSEMTLSAISSVWRWGMNEGTLQEFPMGELSKWVKQKIAYKKIEIEREEALLPIKLRKIKKENNRYLNEDEISNFLNNIKLLKSKSTMIALIMCLSLARRETEVAQAKWKEFNLDRGEWIIPPTRKIAGITVSSGLKIHLEKRDKITGLMVPLPTQVVDLLKSWKKRKSFTKDSEFVFPSVYLERLGYPIETAALSQAVNDNYEKMGIEKFTPHDLRRTAVTHFARMKIERHISNRISAHSISSKIEETYDQFEYYDEKNEALQKWANELERLKGVSDSKI